MGDVARIDADEQVVSPGVHVPRDDEGVREPDPRAGKLGEGAFLRNAAAGLYGDALAD